MIVRPKSGNSTETTPLLPQQASNGRLSVDLNVDAVVDRYRRLSAPQDLACPWTPVSAAVPGALYQQIVDAVKREVLGYDGAGSSGDFRDYWTADEALSAPILSLGSRWIALLERGSLPASFAARLHRQVCSGRLPQTPWRLCESDRFF